MKKLVTIDNLKVFLANLRKEMNGKIQEAASQNEVRLDKSYKEMLELNLRPKNDVDSVLYELIRALRREAPSLTRSVAELTCSGFKQGSNTIVFVGKLGFFVEYDGKDYELKFSPQFLGMGSCLIQLDAPLGKETKVVQYKNFNKRVVGTKVLMSTGKPVVMQLDAFGAGFNESVSWPPKGKTLAGIPVTLREKGYAVIVFETVKRYENLPSGYGEFSPENIRKFVYAVSRKFTSKDVVVDLLDPSAGKWAERDDFFLCKITVHLAEKPPAPPTPPPVIVPPGSTLEPPDIVDPGYV